MCEILYRIGEKIERAQAIHTARCRSAHGEKGKGRSILVASCIGCLLQSRPLHFFNGVDETYTTRGIRIPYTFTFVAGLFTAVYASDLESVQRVCRILTRTTFQLRVQIRRSYAYFPLPRSSDLPKSQPHFREMGQWLQILRGFDVMPVASKLRRPSSLACPEGMLPRVCHVQSELCSPAPLSLALLRCIRAVCLA